MKRDVFAFTRPLAAVVTLILFSVIALTAQTPTAFNYQAVLRDGDGNLRANASVVLKLDIHQSTETGIVVYTETHNTTSDDFGIVNLKLGSVSPGSFAALNWSAGPYFVEVMVDGTSMGVSELLAVPYALHANTANTAISDAVDDADPDPANELNATVVLNGATLEVSDAGGTLTADLSSLVDDADPDPANELNSTVALNVHTLEVSDAGGTLTADLSALVDDADPDPTNELNSTVVLNTNTLTPLLKRMEAQGILERKRDQGDERKVLITLTRKGQQMMEDASEIPGKLAEGLNTSSMDILDVIELRDKLNRLIDSMIASKLETD